MNTREPTASGTELKGPATKETTASWVQRSFGTQKPVLNVTLNHSCQEIPSQTFGDLPNSTRGDTKLYSDEVQQSECNPQVNTSLKIEDRRSNTTLEPTNNSAIVIAMNNSTTQ